MFFSLISLVPWGIDMDPLTKIARTFIIGCTCYTAIYMSTMIEYLMNHPALAAILTMAKSWLWIIFLVDLVAFGALNRTSLFNFTHQTQPQPQTQQLQQFQPPHLLQQPQLSQPCQPQIGAAQKPPVLDIDLLTENEEDEDEDEDEDENEGDEDEEDEEDVDEDDFLDLGEDVKDVKEVKEVKDVKEVKEVKEVKDVKEIKEVKEVKEEPKEAEIPTPKLTQDNIAKYVNHKVKAPKEMSLKSNDLEL